MKTLKYLFQHLGLLFCLLSTQQISAFNTTQNDPLTDQDKNKNYFMDRNIKNQEFNITHPINKLNFWGGKKHTVAALKNQNSVAKDTSEDVLLNSSFATRYTLSGSALPLHKGEKYIGFNLYGPQAHYALNSKFSLGVLSSWGLSPIAVAAKYSIKTANKKINFALGSLIGTSGYINRFRGYGGLAFANVTFGDRVRNFTVSGGYAYLQNGRLFNQPQVGEFTDNTTNHLTQPHPIKGAVFSVAGICKINKKVSLVFDAIFAQLKQKDYGKTIKPFKVIYTKEESTYTILTLMPGLRFHKSDEKAFQVSLAGLSYKAEQSNSNETDRLILPFPMLSYFEKF